MFSVIELTLILQQIKAPLSPAPAWPFQLDIDIDQVKANWQMYIAWIIVLPAPTKIFQWKKTQIVQCLAIIMVIFQRIKRPLQRLLDHAKANIDVIDFRNPQKEVRWRFIN